MKRIILAVDGSTYSEQAARFLSRLPHKSRLEIVVLSVAEVPYFHSDIPTGSWIPELIERAKVAAIEHYQTITQMFEGADVSMRHELREGHLGETIVKMAKDEAAELVVLGARGRSQVSRILLGSTSDYVATHAHCSVLVVRPRESAKPEGEFRIAIAFEDEEPASAAIDEFDDFLWGPEVEVDVVSVASYLYGFFTEFENDPLSVKHMTTALEKASAQVRKTAPRARPHLIESEHIGEGVIKYIEERKSDLIVLGETPRGIVGRALLGSVSRYVLRHAPCSVWVTRNRATR
jgi:nucleotide-binding universal stress UspA family protein